MPALSPRAHFVALAACVTLILGFADKGKISGDGLLRWNALVELMEHHRLTDGKYSILQPIAAAPLYAVADAIERIDHPGEAADERVAAIRKVVQRFNKFVILGLVLLSYRVSRTQLGLSARQATGGVALLLFGSFLIPHARDFYSECLWTTLSLASLVLVCTLRTEAPGTRRRAAALVAVTALATALNPLLGPVHAGASLVAGLLATRGASVRDGAARLFRAAVSAEVRWTASGVALGVALCLLENAVRRGAALDFGYGGEGFTTPVWVGLPGMLVAPARGLLFFVPTVFLGIALARRPPRGFPAAATTLTLVGLAYSALLVAAYSTWHAWHGAWYWGPRFLLPVSVLGVAWAVLALRYAWADAASLARAWIVTLVAASVLVYKCGVAIGPGPLVRCLETAAREDDCYWRVEFLPYASYLRPGNLASMATHPSTAVEIVGLLLLGALASAAPGAEASSRGSTRYPMSGAHERKSRSVLE